MTDDETTDKNNVGETDGWDSEPRANTNTVATSIPKTVFLLPHATPGATEFC